jgi:hypothetical protein
VPTVRERTLGPLLGPLPDPCSWRKADDPGGGRFPSDRGCLDCRSRNAAEAPLEFVGTEREFWTPAKGFRCGGHRRTITGMRIAGPVSNHSAAIWQRVIQFEGELSPAAARALLKLHFSQRDHSLMDKLARKARAGTLTPEEQVLLDTFERLGCLLDIVHSEARRALKKKPKRAS